MTEATDDTLAAGTVLSERYRVESLLGRGAMGAVYLVQHIHMRKRLALKVLLSEVSANEEVVARFEREAMAAAHIDHPNVVAATDFGRTPDGAFFLVLEYVEGESLRQALGSGGPFDPRRAASIGTQIARALARAHSLGIVHRDLKPDNVMLVRRGGPEEIVKVLDFGIAKLTGIAVPEDEKVLTRVGAVFGTPEYMAPEQAMGEDVDARADLYALGITLYEMLTGLRPFEADNAVVLLTLHVTAVPPPMSLRAPGVAVPPALEALVMQLLSKKPADRLQTAPDVERALDEVLGSMPGAPRSSARMAALPSGASTSQPDVTTGPGGTRPANWSAHDAAARTNLAVAPVLRGAPKTFGDVMDRVLTRARAVDPVWLKARIKRVGPFVAAGLLAIVVGTCALGRSPKPHAVASSASAHVDAGASGSWLPFATIGKLSDARVAAAATAGFDALTALEREYPKDARVAREQVRWHATRGKQSAALATLGRLATLDAAMAAEPDMDRVLDAALDSADPAIVEAAIALLEGPMGSHGVDVLMDRATQAGPSKARFQRSLKKPEVRANASPAAAIALELRDAKTCDAKRDLIARAQANGDARTLAQLTTLKKNRGCGFFGSADCWRCLRKDTALEDAISALEAKR